MLFIYSTVFILGISIGSFLNVVIDRLPMGKSVVKGRSYCDYCRHTLSWYDLVPVASFFWLHQKCRFCKKKISWQYPVVEVTAGILFIFTYTTMIRIIEPVNLMIILIYYLTIVSGLTAIFFTDLKYRIIPDQVLVLLTTVTLIYLYLFNRNNLQDHLLAALIVFLFFLMMVAVTRGKGMGLGDVKYAFVMGLILGTNSSIISFYLSFLTGAVISLILIVAGRKKMKSTIPFGPFLVSGTFVSLFYGDLLWLTFKGIIGL